MVLTVWKKKQKQYRTYLCDRSKLWGRDEIRRAAGKLAEDVKEGRLQPEDITESVFASYLDTADIPDRIF